MRNRRGRSVGLRNWAIAAAVAAATVGAALAQDPGANKGGANNAARGKAGRGAVRAPGGAPPKTLKKAANDPFARPANDLDPAAPPVWPYHYKFKLMPHDGTPLAAFYYPAKPATAAPAVILVHEKGRSGKDFEDGIDELNGKGLAEHLQAAGYAVLMFDLRGHGANQRRELSPKDGPQLVRDLQAAYIFLIDRHNREELNLAKLGVIALGEGADLAVAWAASTGAAVSSEGRLGDLGALVLLSPLPEGFGPGQRLSPNLSSLAPRGVPILLLAGQRDHQSVDAAKAAQPILARHRQDKVELLATSLHGYKLLRLQPDVVPTIERFLDTTIKARRDEWEPRYNLAPVAAAEIELVRKAAAKKAGEPDRKAAPKADEPAAKNKADAGAK